MNKPYHIEICQRALGEYFSHQALDTIITANTAQDNLRGQFGHPEFHFDSSAFEAGYRYIDEQRLIILDALKNEKDISPAWKAFGRLTHSAQDFYAHSNYLSLWAASYPNGEVPDPSQVEPLIPEYLNHPLLKTNRIYLWDYLAYLPGLYKIAGKILPKDSHYHTNLDHPGQGYLFPYSIEAAVKRTIHEFEDIQARIKNTIGTEAITKFKNR